MKFILFPLVLIILASCGGLPETPCECHDQVNLIEKEIHAADSTMRLFAPENKAGYRTQIDDLLNQFDKSEKVFEHCREIYRNQGLCERKDVSSFWNCGLYLPDRESFAKKYTGDWEKDSLEHIRISSQEQLGFSDSLNEKNYFPRIFSDSTGNNP